MSVPQPHRRGPSLLVIGIGVLLSVCLFTMLASILSRSRGSSGGIPATRTPVPSDPVASVIVVKDSLACESYGANSMIVSGRVQNVGSVPTTSIEVVVVALDGATDVSQNRTYADDGELAPGKISGFTGFVTTTGVSADGCRAWVGDVR